MAKFTFEYQGKPGKLLMDDTVEWNGTSANIFKGDTGIRDHIMADPRWSDPAYSRIEPMRYKDWPSGDKWLAVLVVGGIVLSALKALGWF